MSDASTAQILDFYEMIRRSAKAPAKPLTEVSTVYEADPTYAGRSKVTITAPSAADVQAQITRIFDLVEREGGFSNFLHPYRVPGGFGSRGEIITDLVPVA